MHLHRVFKAPLIRFQCADGRRPRLPRTQSTGYDLKADAERFFRGHICPTLARRDETNQFAVLITVFKADDRLGRADLDNYATPLLNAVTASECVWKDDRQVDLLNVNREVSSLTVVYPVDSKGALRNILQKAKNLLKILPSPLKLNRALCLRLSRLDWTSVAFFRQVSRLNPFQGHWHTLIVIAETPSAIPP